MRPIIGITPDFNPGHSKGRSPGGEATYFLRARYAEAVRDMGGLPVILPFASRSSDLSALLKGLDGLLITGSGPDLDPRLYGERQRARFRIMSRERSAFELALVRVAVRKDRPVFGICGGLQVLNVALGGGLIQDIATQVPGALAHRQEAAATRPSHRVMIAPGTRLRRILKRDAIRVNSSHHQAARRIAPGLLPNAVAPDGVIEGIEDPRRRFVLGVQWHPEFLYRRDENSRKLFRAFLAAAGLE